jgi:hypothetical protein
MALPRITQPAQGATHNHTIAAQKVFKWDPGTVTPGYWRVKVGATPGSWNYYTGPAIAEPNHQDSGVMLNPKPLNGKTCYTFVEWGQDGINFPNQGDITSFICKP